MSRIESGPVRPVGAVDVRLARQAGGYETTAEKITAARPAPNFAVVRSDVLDAGEPPVDVERVSMIRKSVESGTYPILPTRIADEMIAAGFMLRSPK